ncbi:hypothetical protein CQW23_14907 [Capsicum baccatum]|uniref:Calmodulin-binding domain-containing protein n=1 Tax=Capsicum baccatum TaxID=33114 RepID=A0A2G2WKQ8_CAPBA|nr:hypothetical protein CQW23_14907 [Capsicum baccatum]
MPTIDKLGMTSFLTLGLVDTKEDPMVELIKKELDGATSIRRAARQGQPNVEALHDQPQTATDPGASSGGVSGGVVCDGGSILLLLLVMIMSMLWPLPTLMFYCKCEVCKDIEDKLLENLEAIAEAAEELKSRRGVILSNEGLPKKVDIFTALGKEKKKELEEFIKMKDNGPQLYNNFKDQYDKICKVADSGVLKFDQLVSTFQWDKEAIKYVREKRSIHTARAGPREKTFLIQIQPLLKLLPKFLTKSKLMDHLLAEVLAKESWDFEDGPFTISMRPVFDLSNGAKCSNDSASAATSGNDETKNREMRQVFDFFYGAKCSNEISSISASNMQEKDVKADPNEDLDSTSGRVTDSESKSCIPESENKPSTGANDEENQHDGDDAKRSEIQIRQESTKTLEQPQKWILLQRFVKELEKVTKINPRKPLYLRLNPDPEAEKVNLRTQTSDERKRGEEWMLDYALQLAISQLGPTQKRKVELLIKAFETVVPPQGDNSQIAFPKLRASKEKEFVPTEGNMGCKAEKVIAGIDGKHEENDGSMYKNHETQQPDEMTSASNDEDLVEGHAWKEDSSKESKEEISTAISSLTDEVDGALELVLLLSDVASKVGNELLDGTDDEVEDNSTSTERKMCNSLKDFSETKDDAQTSREDHNPRQHGRSLCRDDAVKLIRKVMPSNMETIEHNPHDQRQVLLIMDHVILSVLWKRQRVIGKKLTKLSFLAVNSNNFTGEIPPILDNLSKLYWLDLADNQLIGSIPISTSSSSGLDLLKKEEHLEKYGTRYSKQSPFILVKERRKRSPKINGNMNNNETSTHDDVAVLGGVLENSLLLGCIDFISIMEEEDGIMVIGKLKKKKKMVLDIEEIEEKEEEDDIEFE